jgi:serine/threonine protein kinase
MEDKNTEDKNTEDKSDKLKEQLCKDFDFLPFDKTDVESKDNCEKCEIIKNNFNFINTHYEFTGLANMIRKINDYDNDKLKILAIELYNIIHQNDGNGIDDEKDYKTMSCQNLNFIKRYISMGDFRKLKNITLSSDNIFRNINNYILMNEIGSGSQGIVYLGVDKNTGEKYAIKEIFNVKKYNYPGNKFNNLKREIAIMKNANHENIIKLYDIIDDIANKKMYIVMQYVEKGPILKQQNDLSNNNKQKYYPLPVDIVIKYSKQIISGLRYLHYNKITHRDIKPDNILLGDNDIIYLSDFGVSEFLEKRRDSIQRKNGTILFFSPEMFLLGSNIEGINVDIWALGVTIFLMLFGSFPFNGDSYQELKDNIINKDPDFPDNILPEQKDFFKKVFDKDPSMRLTLRKMKHHPFLNLEIIKNNIVTMNKRDLIKYRFLNINDKPEDFVEEMVDIIPNNNLFETPQSDELNESSLYNDKFELPKDNLIINNDNNNLHNISDLSLSMYPEISPSNKSEFITNRNIIKSPTQKEINNALTNLNL